MLGTVVRRSKRGASWVLLFAVSVACSRTPAEKATGITGKPQLGTRSKGEEVQALRAYPEQLTDEKAPAARAPNPISAAPKRKMPAEPTGGMGMAQAYGAGGLGLSGRGLGASGIGTLRGAPVATTTAPLLPSPSAPLVEKDAEFNTEAYAPLVDNPFLTVKNQPLSTFSVDVDTASYANARRFLDQGQLPPKDAIRIEEWINYFSYDYANPTGDAPVSIQSEVSSCPWEPSHELVRIGVKAKPISQAGTPARNLVFLIDVSGSMQTPDKLPLLKSGLALLARQIRTQDKVSIVVYAGASGLVLPATNGNQQGKILGSLAALEAGGSTNGGDGIRLAYKIAQENVIKGGINRVILATDGDFNVGTTSEGELQRLIEDKRKSGVFLTVLGFGTGNVKDSTMELLADKGNGNYAYVDSLAEARKVLVKEAGATLVTVAKDVKLQVEFNPKKVSGYRLIGYENRMLAKEDFNNDKKDAGDMGAGHTVTAIYEVAPIGSKTPAGTAPAVDSLKYQSEGAASQAANNDELMTVKLRYKLPNSDTSTKLDHVINDSAAKLPNATADHRFAVAVAEFAMLLRGSASMKGQKLDDVRKLAEASLGSAPSEEKQELLLLMERAAKLHN